MRTTRTRLLPQDFREHARDLRERYGPQPWLTVASGAVAEAYRLAGMTADEFTRLLLDQTAERGRLLIHLRRKPIMRLRTGFDGGEGCIRDVDGVLSLNLTVWGSGSYSERDIVFVNGTEYRHVEEQKLRLAGRPRSSLILTGGMDRPLSAVDAGIPRCLRPRSIRACAIRQERASWGEGATIVDVRTHWETLAPMPASVSRELGLPVQTSLDAIPWMPVAHDGRLDPAPVKPSSATGRQADRAPPALRLVSSR